LRISALALVAAGFAAVAMAEDAAPSAGNAAKPAQLPANPLPGSAASPAEQAIPAPKAGAMVGAECIDEDGEFESHGKTNTFVFTLENKCEAHLRCTIDAYVTGAKGPSSGYGTVILGPKSKGAAAKSSYTMKVKMPGGTAQASRSCKVF
jgi:hypothetical protein